MPPPLPTGALLPYDVVHAPGLLKSQDAQLADQLRSFQHVFAVLDPQVSRRYGRQLDDYLTSFAIPHELITLPSHANNEENKSVNSWIALVSGALNRGVDDGVAFLAMGGGVTSDVTGFVSSTLRRGIPYFAIPTTLTAAVDAAISPKTAINVGTHKNAVGTIAPPQVILWDENFLRTDPSQTTGFVELLKLGIIRSRPLFEYLERHAHRLLDENFQCSDAPGVIDFAIRLFLGMKFEHPYYGNKPASLRAFGHSFSRRLESESHFRLTHGEAVAVEMAIAMKLVEHRQLIAASEANRVYGLLHRLRLLPNCSECDVECIWPVFENRHRAGRPFYFPVPHGEIGYGAFLENFNKQELSNAIAAVSLG